MKRFVLTIVGIIGAVMAFVVLVPDAAIAPGVVLWRDPELRPIQKRLGALQDSIRTMDGVYERLVALEAARSERVSTGARTARPSLTFVKDPALSATVNEAFERRIRDELGPLADSLKYPVRVHLVHNDAPISAYRRIVVLPRAESEPCSLVLLIARPRGGDVLPLDQDRVIGTCGLYAAFGAPGAGMTKWLLDTRGRYAVADIAMPLQTSRGRHRLRGAEVASAPEVAACLAGSDSACVTAWEDLRWLDRANSRDAAWLEATQGTVRAYPFSALSNPGRNLGDLRGAMTDVRFRELWKSALDPAGAYEAVEGRSIALFMREQLLLELEPYRPGPLHADLPLALGVAIAALAATLAIRFTKRKRS